MESQPQNPELRNNPANIHPYISVEYWTLNLQAIIGDPNPITFLIEQSERYTLSLSHKVVSGSDIMLCNKLDKPPVIVCLV